MSFMGAGCFHEFAADNRQMSLTEFATWWDDLSDPKVATSVSTLVDWKGDLEKLCSRENICSKEVKDDVAKLSTKVQGVTNTALKIHAKP